VPAPPPSTGGIAPFLRRLYFVRFGFAIVWAGLLVVTASTINPLSATLLVLYPVFDMAAAVVDARSSRSAKPVPGLYVNIAISLLAAVGLAIALSSGAPRRAAGLGCLGHLVRPRPALRRPHPPFAGRPVAMIISGAISTVAGASFILQAGQPGAGLSTLAGFATLGGIFFLVSARRPGRAAKSA
jgi:hypothetical protein